MGSWHPFNSSNVPEKKKEKRKEKKRTHGSRQLVVTTTPAAVEIELLGLHIGIIHYAADINRSILIITTHFFIQMCSLGDEPVEFEKRNDKLKFKTSRYLPINEESKTGKCQLVTGWISGHEDLDRLYMPNKFPVHCTS